MEDQGAVEWDQYLDPATTLPAGGTATFSLMVRTALPAALQFDQTNAGSPQGVRIAFKVTAKDTADNPFTGKQLISAISGANAGTQSATIGADGTATVTDPGTNAGADTVVSFIDLNGNGTREANEPQGSALATFVDHTPPTCSVKVSGDRPGGYGGAGKPLVITVNCDSTATVATASTLTVTPPAATTKKKAKKSDTARRLVTLFLVVAAGGVTVSVEAVATVAVESQLTVMTSSCRRRRSRPAGRQRPDRAGRRRVVEANVTSTEPCGSLASRVPLPLRSMNDTTVSAPAFVTGSSFVAVPSAPIVADCVRELAPLIAEISCLPVNGLSAVSFAVTLNVIGTPCGEARASGRTAARPGGAVRPMGDRFTVPPAGSGVAGSRYWSHSTAPALSTGSPTTVSS